MLDGKTRFSVLDKEKIAKPTDVHRGTHVRMQGSEKDRTYWATEIQIWEAASKPPGR